MIAAMKTLATDDEVTTKNEPGNWTCYSAGDSTAEWVMQAAENPSTPADILGMLAESCNVEVRMAVGDNGNASLETMMILVEDESADLRYQLAENHNVHESVLELLSKDSNPYVARRAQKTLARMEASAAVVVPVVDVASIVSITWLASTNVLGSKLTRMVF